MAKKLHQLATLYVDQCGSKIYARSVKELKEKAGPGKVSKVYRDIGTDVFHCGYCVGDRWFDAYAPVTVPAEPERRPEKEQDRLDMRKARRLVKRHPNIKLDIEKGSDGAGWWVWSAYTDAIYNPIEGEAFCASGREVLQQVEKVVAYGKDL